MPAIPGPGVTIMMMPMISIVPPTIPMTTRFATL